MGDNAMYDVVSIQNIDDEDFVFEYNRSAGNTPYVIKAGEVRRFPRFLAQHAVTHLIDQILTKRKMKINNQMARTDLGAQIVIQEEKFNNDNVLSEAQRLQKQVEELNKPSELEAILQKKREQAAATPANKAEELPPLPEDKEDFAGLKEESVSEPAPEVAQEVHKVTENVVDKGIPETVLGDKPPEPVKPVPTVPTRSELMDYAKNTLKLTLDEKGEKQFAKMTVPELIKAFQYPMEGDEI